MIPLSVVHALTIALATMVTLVAGSHLDNPSPDPIQIAAGLEGNAPSAHTLGGVHILLDNDVDTKTPKYPMILLSKHRTYKDSKDVCSSLGEGKKYSRKGGVLVCI
jgi:hypothetical protein